MRCGQRTLGPILQVISVCDFWNFLLSTNLCHCDSPTMVLISSKTLIQAHAVFLVVIAGYLVKSPEVITDCDLVFMMGEALKIVRRTNVSDSQVHFYHIGHGSSYVNLILTANTRDIGLSIPVKPAAIPLHLLCHTHLHRGACRPRPAVQHPLPRSS